jgi:hypothetical protein
MNQEFSSTLFYGNQGLNPEEFTGLSVRYSDLSANNAENIIDAGGTGSDNSSIWLIVWGDQSCHGLFPKGSKAGLRHEDLGLVTVQDTNGIAGNRLRAYQDRFTFKAGLAVKDWRYAVRIANIDISNLVADSSAADLVEIMIKAMHRIPNMNFGRAAFYCNRTVYQMLDLQRRSSILGAGIQYEEVDGKIIPHFRGVPIRKCDSLLETEARVV